MATPTIDQYRAQGNADFQKSYLWELEFIRPPALISPDLISQLNFMCISSDVPKKTGQTSTIMMRGEQIFDPGIYNVTGTITLTFVERTNAIIRQVIAGWEQVCADKADVFYNLTADIALRSMDNQKDVNYEYILYLAFFEDSNVPQFDSGQSSDPMQPSMTLRYTDYIQRPLSN